MALYKVLDNSLTERYQGNPAGAFTRPVWVDGIGLCGYWYVQPRNDWYYGASSIDGQVSKINETLSALEPQGMIYDEIRNSTLIGQYGGTHLLEYDAVNGLYLVNGWDTEDFAEYDHYYSHTRGRSKMYGVGGITTPSVYSYPLGTRESTSHTVEGALPADMLDGYSWTGKSSFYPMRDGNYMVSLFSSGAMCAYNPISQEFFGPVYYLEDRVYQCIAYSKDLNLVIAAYNLNSYLEAQVQAYALETVPNAIGSPQTVDGSDIRSGEIEEIKVRVTGDRGEGVSGERVAWNVASGNGTLQYAQSTTDDEGWAFNVFAPDDSAVPFNVQIDVSVKT